MRRFLRSHWIDWLLVIGIVLVLGAILLIAASPKAQAYKVQRSVVGASEFYLDVARDDINTLSLVHVFGRNSDVDTVDEDLWDAGGIWRAPTAARVHNIASTVTTDSGSQIIVGSASGGTTTTLIDNSVNFITTGTSTGDVLVNDTQNIYGIISTFTATGVTVYDMVRDDIFKSGATEFKNNDDDSYRIISNSGIGASAILVNGLDANWNEINEIVIGRGTTDSATTNSYRMINKMLVIHSGNGANAGTISATAVTDSTITAQIATNNSGTGANVTQSTVYQVPAGKTAFLTSWHASLNRASTGTGADISLLIKPIGQGFQVRSRLAIFRGQNTAIEFMPTGAIVVPQMAIIKLQADSSDDDFDISAGYDLILERN